MPRLSYGAKSFLLDVCAGGEGNSSGGGESRREFLKKGLVLAGGVLFLSLALSGKAEPSPPSGIMCGCYGDCHTQCYSNCYCACHSDCGRKSW